MSVLCRGLLLFLAPLLFISPVFAQKNSTNGEVFTPKGDLRILILCVGFQGYDNDQGFPHWPADQDLPDYMPNATFPAVFYKDTSDFSRFQEDTTVKNLSKLYHEMSMGKFRLMADVYPKRINIDPTNVRSWSEINRKAIQKMQEMDPDFDWSPYDQRKNRPDFEFDNSQTGPDGIADYVVFYYRYRKPWKVQPRPGMERWVGTGGGVSTIMGVSKFPYGEMKIGPEGFFGNDSGTLDAGKFAQLFKHELAHEWFSSPHYGGANGTIGNYYHVFGASWGSTGPNTQTKLCLNAWERWVLGWTEITHDLSTPKDNGVYTIDDYVTTGQSMRIEIPHSGGQHLWIENHQKKSELDHNGWNGLLKNSPEGTAGIGDIDKGLHLFVENMLPSREAIKMSMVTNIKNVNGFRAINAQGNYDYVRLDTSIKTTDWTVYWNNRVYGFKRGEANPLSGINPYIGFRDDFDGDGKIEHRGNFNSAKTESQAILWEEVDDTMRFFYGAHTGRNATAKRLRRSDAFQVGDMLSIARNPPIVNTPTFSKKKQEISPIYLNGLRIEVLSIDSEGRMTIKVEFDQPIVDQNVRWTGNIALKRNEHQAGLADLTINKRKKVLINRSNTFSRTIKDSLGRFNSLTLFTVQDSSTIVLEKGADVILQDDSKMTIKAGCKMELKPWARLVAKDQSVVVFESGSQLEGKMRRLKVKGRGKIILSEGVILPNGDILAEEKIID